MEASSSPRDDVPYGSVIELDDGRRGKFLLRRDTGQSMFLAEGADSAVPLTPEQIGRMRLVESARRQVQNVLSAPALPPSPPPAPSEGPLRIYEPDLGPVVQLENNPSHGVPLQLIAPRLPIGSTVEYRNIRWTVRTENNSLYLDNPERIRQFVTYRLAAELGLTFPPVPHTPVQLEQKGFHRYVSGQKVLYRGAGYRFFVGPGGNAVLYRENPQTRESEFVDDVEWNEIRALGDVPAGAQPERQSGPPFDDRAPERLQDLLQEGSLVHADGGDYIVHRDPKTREFVLRELHLDRENPFGETVRLDQIRTLTLESHERWEEDMRMFMELGRPAAGPRSAGSRLGNFLRRLNPFGRGQ